MLPQMFGEKSSSFWREKLGRVNFYFTGPIINKAKQIMICTNNTYNSILINIVQTQNDYF